MGYKKKILTIASLLLVSLPVQAITYCPEAPSTAMDFSSYNGFVNFILLAFVFFVIIWVFYKFRGE